MDNPAARIAGDISPALQAFPPLITTAILVAGALAVAAILHAIIKRTLLRWSQRRRGFVLFAFLGRAERFLFFALAVGLVSSIVPATPLSPHQQIIALRFLSAIFIGIIGWAALVAIDVVSERQLSLTSKNIQDDIMDHGAQARNAMAGAASHLACRAGASDDRGRAHGVSGGAEIRRQHPCLCRRRGTGAGTGGAAGPLQSHRRHPAR